MTDKRTSQEVAAIAADLLREDGRINKSIELLSEAAHDLHVTGEMINADRLKLHSLNIRDAILTLEQCRKPVASALSQAEKD